MNFLVYVGLCQINITKKIQRKYITSYVKLVVEQDIQTQMGSEVGGQRQAPVALSPKITQ